MYYYFKKNIRYLIFPILSLFIGITKIFYHDIEILTDYFFTDDTFYYLNTAWNLKIYDFVTFDGINKTNGLQLFWFYLLAFFQLFFSSKITFIYGTLLLCLLINIIQYRVIFLFTKLLRINYLYYFVSIFWFHLSLSNTFLSGMENSISLLILSLAIYKLYLLANCEHEKNLLRQNYSSIILLTLLPFCRVDYAFYSILFFIYLCTIINKIRNKKMRLQILTNNICIAFIGLVIMLLLFYKMGELFLPVSGLIKQQYVSLSLESIIGTFLKKSHEVMYDVNTIFPFIKRVLFISSFYQFIFFIGYSLIICIIIINKIKSNKTLLSSSAKKMGFFLFISLVLVLHQLYLSTYGEDLLHYCKWWQSGFYLFLVYLIPFIIILTINVILKYTNLIKFKSWIFSSLIILLFMLNLIHQYSFYYSTIYSLSPPYKYYKECQGTRIELSSWINSNIEPDVVLGSYNAGTIGYFTNNSVINLDGLINGKEYYNILIDKGKNIITYLKKYNCKYVVDRKNALKNNKLLKYATLFKELRFDNCNTVYSIYRIND